MLGGYGGALGLRRSHAGLGVGLTAGGVCALVLWRGRPDMPATRSGTSVRLLTEPPTGSRPDALTRSPTPARQLGDCREFSSTSAVTSAKSPVSPMA
jgi:hypothetical protein